MPTEHKTLLSLTRLLYKAFQGNRPKPFNLFSVLRSSHDEVNLHSRFLAALLDHRDHRTGLRENLKDFVTTVLDLKIDDRFDWSEPRIQRERSNIDILITLDHQVAIVLENKIYAADQERQLFRYLKTVKGDGFKEIHLAYLTLDGSSPSPMSLGSMNTSDPESYGRLKRVGYNSEVFGDWLRNCRRRAFEEPELRESILQYLQLVRELTGTNRGGYMDALRNLLKEGDNLRLADHIADALVEAKIDLQMSLWERMKEAIRIKSDLYFKDDGSPTLVEAVRNYYLGSRNRLYYGIVHDLPGYKTLNLRVSREDEGKVPYILFGVSRKSNERGLGEEEYGKVKILLEEKRPLGKKGKSSPGWPFFLSPETRVPDPLEGSLEDYEREIEEFAEEIAFGMDAIQRAAGET